MVNKKNNPVTKAAYSIAEAAKILGVSRISVYNWIKAGKLKAERVGRAYVIPHPALSDHMAGALTDKLKGEISKAVSRTVREYGETLRRLGKE